MSYGGSSDSTNETIKTQARNYTAQIFDSLLREADVYIKTDFDKISRENIRATIDKLQGLGEEFDEIQKKLPSNAKSAFKRKSDRILGSVTAIIPFLYAARHLADEGKRDVEFYQHLVATHEHWRRIRVILKPRKE